MNIDNPDSIYETAWTYVCHVVDIAREPFLILDNSLRIQSANDAFYRTFLVGEQDTENKLVFELGNGQWNSPQLRKLLEDILPKNTFFKDFEVDHEFPLIGRKIMMVNARMIFAKDLSKPLIIMAMEDVSKQRLVEEKLKDYAKELEAQVLERTKELESRIQQLESLNEAMIDRELRMVELKTEIEEMKKNMNK